MTSWIRHQLRRLGRSPQWRAVRAAHLAREGWCRKCGGLASLQVHHILPVHLFPQHELDRNNLITLCEAGGKCHLMAGHLGNWDRYNPDVRSTANFTP